MNATKRSSTDGFRWLPRLTGCVLTAVAAACTTGARAGMITDIGGAVVWFDADQIEGLADGNLLAAWDDESGNANHLAQANADNQPTYRDGPNGLNGRAVVRFDGDPAESVAPDIGDRMTTDAIPTTNDFSTLIVWKMDALPTLGSQIPFSKFQQSSGHREWAFWWSSNLRTSTSANGNTRTDHTYPGVPAPTTDYVLDIVTKEGANAPLWRDGTQTVGTGTVQTTLLATANSPISVGTATGATTSYLKGNIAEAISYNRSLNDAERILAQNYLAAKWARALMVDDYYTGDENAQGDYDSDVIGIGQSAGGKLATSHGSGLRISEQGGTLNADGLFVLAGHKVTSNTLTEDDLDALAEVTHRWGRVWYVDGTGDVSAEVQFDFSDGGLGAPAPGFSYALLYSPTNAFDFSVSSMTPTVNDDQVSFVLPQGFADGYYTLGLAVPEPASWLLALLAVAVACLSRAARRHC